MHTEITSGNVYYNETQSILLSATISVHKAVIPPGTHNNTQLSVRVALVSKNGGAHLNSTIWNPKEDRESGVPGQKNDRGKSEREIQVVALKKHTSYPYSISKSNRSQGWVLFFGVSRGLHFGPSITFASKLTCLLLHFRDASKNQKIGLLISFWSQNLEKTLNFPIELKRQKWIHQNFHVSPSMLSYLHYCMSL